MLYYILLRNFRIEPVYHQLTQVIMYDLSTARMHRPGLIVRRYHHNVTARQVHYNIDAEAQCIAHRLPQNN